MTVRRPQWAGRWNRKGTDTFSAGIICFAASEGSPRLGHRRGNGVGPLHQLSLKLGGKPTLCSTRTERR
jgi:hypothetical protein